MSEKNKESSNIKSIIWTIILLGVCIGGVFLFNIILRFALNTSIPITVVSGQSMEPTFYEGDLLFVKGVPYDQIVPGDHNARNGSIIVFRRSYDNLLIVHRVTGVRYNYSGSGIYEFQTWGDNNPVPDGWQPQQNVLGVVIFRIPWIGWVSLVFTKYPFVGFSIIGLIIILLVVSLFYPEKQEKLPDESNSDEKNKELNGREYNCMIIRIHLWN